MNIILTLNEPQFQVLWAILDSAVAVGIWGNESRSPSDAIHYALLRDKVQAIAIKLQARHQLVEANIRRGETRHA